MRKVNRPLWLEGAESSFPPLERDLELDVAVVGAGITGATTALLLAEAGKSVALVEMNAVCSGATGYTTAKLTVGHGLAYADLVEDFGVDVARRYAASNQQAIERVDEIVTRHRIDCDFERASNFVYVEPGSPTSDLEREVEAARAAGVAAELTSETDLPYAVAAAIRVDGQAQFHPWKYVAALARGVVGAGGAVVEATRVTGVGRGDTCLVQTTRGTIRAAHVVLATQLPFLDRGLYFAKAHPVKSYAVAAAVEHAPRAMYISADQPTRSVRSTPGPNGGRVLIVGGEGHRPGEELRTEERYRRLERFLVERFGADGAHYRWSTHDYVPVDGLPYIGRLRRGDDRIHVATGFAKWGMTKGTLAAGILADAILGRPNPDAVLYDASRIEARRSAPGFAKENGRVAVAFFRDRVRSRPSPADVAALAPGDGTIVRAGAKQYAVHRDDEGRLHVLSARCTHLGCIVGWNGADRAWECPCHGSRFAADGALLQGPATADLPPDALP